MTRSRPLLRDASCVVAGQLLTAVGMLFGIRLLTEVVDSSTYGEVVLLLGLAALAMSVACGPLMQAALHFFPEHQSRGQSGLLRAALRRSFLRVLPWLLGATLALGAVQLGWAKGSIGAVVLLAIVFGCDCIRSMHTTLLNAARRHRRYAVWMVAEAWLRPLLAVLAVQLWGASALCVLGAYAAASLVLILLLAPRPETDSPTADASDSAALDRRIWRYARPLFPLGLVDWTNGVADRYLIGGLLSMSSAGIYAANYGLASRPFQLVSGSLELTLRPPYQAAVSAGDHARAARLLRHWFLAVTGIGLLGVGLIHVLRRPLGDLLLGADFRAGADLMPWIALGYALLAMAQVFQRVCFAHGDTRAVLAIQASAAAVGVIATAVGASGWGLTGAALAVPVCFAVQLAVSIAAARRTRRRALRRDGVSASG